MPPAHRADHPQLKSGSRANSQPRFRDGVNGASSQTEYEVSETQCNTAAESFASERFLRQRFKPAEQIFLARDAGDLIANAAVLEEQERWNGADVVFESETLVVVYIHFCDLDRIGFFTRHFVEQRRDHFARPAPFGPKIDNHRFVALHDFAVEIGFIQGNCGGVFHSQEKYVQI